MKNTKNIMKNKANKAKVDTAQNSVGCPRKAAGKKAADKAADKKAERPVRPPTPKALAKAQRAIEKEIIETRRRLNAAVREQTALKKASARAHVEAQRALQMFDRRLRRTERWGAERVKECIIRLTRRIGILNGRLGG